MRLHFPYLLPGEQPITTVAEYLKTRQWYEELEHRVHNLLDKSEELSPHLLEQLHLLKAQAEGVMYEFLRRQPFVLGSRCPYCGVAMWMNVGIFSLVDEFWYHEGSNGRDEVLKESRCPHLFCVDGALSLNGYQPSETLDMIKKATNSGGITMASEVPFVKPRVLNLPTILAVVHSFPVAERYTAYPIVYFAEQQPDQMDFCIGWARIEYIDREKQTGGTFIGKRSDVQDYDLLKWVRQGKLFWLDPTDEEHPLVRGPAEAFPYGNVPGRRYPYTIKDGQVRDLPIPTESGPTYYLEDRWGPRVVPLK